MQLFLSTLLTLFLSLQVSADDSQLNCQQGNLPGSHIVNLELILQLQGPLGVTPRFCRDYKVSTDDKNDEALKSFVESSFKSEASILTDKMKMNILSVFQKVAVKKMWHLVSEESQVRAYFSNECSELEIYRWPLVKKGIQKPTLSDSEEKNLLSNFKKICKWKWNPDFNELAPYLSKDVLAESMLLLAQMYPDNFKAVTQFTCSEFSKTPEVVLKDERYAHFVLGPEYVQNKEEFSRIFKTYAADDLAFIKAMQEQYRNQKLSEELSSEEIKSLKTYTDNGFTSINTCLRSGDCSAENLEHISHITEALNKVKDAESKTLFRGTGVLPQSIQNSLKEASANGKALLLDQAYLSSSANTDVAKRFSKVPGGILYVIKSKRCLSLDSLSKNPLEDEFLCPAGMKFIVRSIATPGEWAEKIYVLDEVSDEK